MAKRPCVLFDLDDTLVLSRPLAHIREAARDGGNWGAVYARFGETSLPASTAHFLRGLMDSASVGVVTMAPRSYAERLLRHHGLTLPVLVAFHDTERHKPDPEPLLRALDMLAASAGAATYVGDDAVDSIAALNAGVVPLQVDWWSAGRSGPGRFASWVDVREMLDALWGAPQSEPRSGAESGSYSSALHAEACVRWYSPDEWASHAYYPSHDAAHQTCLSTQFVFDVKNRDSQAQDAAASILIEAIQRNESYLRLVRRVRFVAGIPGHRATSHQSPMELIAERVADAVPWLAVGGRLRRVVDVPRSATADVRPGIATHAASMAWEGASLSQNDGLLLLDDVLTRGATFRGAQLAVGASSTCLSVVGFFLAKTQSSEGLSHSTPSNNATAPPAQVGPWRGPQPC